MNRIKRTCALLLAIVLILGVAFQPGIGGVFAENTEQTEQIAELAPQAGEETAAEPATEATTQPAVESAAQTVTESKVETETAGEPGVLSFYEQLMACGSLIDFEALLCAEENTAALDALSQEELEQLLEHVEKISAAIAEPTEEDTLLSEELLKKLNEHIIVICPECGEANGHAETCSQYKAEDGDYVWAALTDTELAEWLMDEANAETVKAILSSEGEEYDALNSRIEAILSGEDEELVQKLQEYLSKLMEMDEAALLAENGTICFDLALGNVTIGPSGYSGYIYVDGVKTEVKGEHADANKYYIYQSTEANKATTGYKKQTDLDIKQNCQIPEYPRVSYDGKSWTKYVENNINVEKVSIDWTEAAKNSNRTDTKNHIIFEQKSNYTADVTIDNIWSTYYEASTSRTTGGIGAHLDDMTNTTISLRLKGDNRVGCVHYSSDQHSGNKLIFSNGDDASNSGSITVADFKENFGANHWNAVIGAADSPAFKSDMSEGIVIDSGVIYAGATWRDNCTAIGGGGNNYGSVTINSGTVTAVTAGTGTAIGGGIGYGNKGGDTDVNINGGIIYAYNLGINPETDKANGGFKKFVPAAAIGGGGSNGEAGNLEANITITGGTIYAQSMGGPGIGGGGSANSYGGPATIDISGGTIIAKSTGGMYGTETILPGVSIGGGTGADGGGAVKLNISGVATKLRTGSIGGGKATKKGAKIGHADVTISGGDITGQIIMAGGANDNCKFKMIDGRIHSTNLIAGNTINEAGITDPRTDIPILYLEKNGGAVWMQDPNGVVNISGGTIENCTAELGGAVYMAGGNFTLSGSGTIQGNVARRGDGETVQGYGGGVYVTGGNANINGGSVNGNKAQIRGGGVYVTGGNVNVNDGSISSNVAGFAPDTTTSLPDDAGMGGGVYLEGTGLFTMKGGTISGNTANYRGGGIFLTQKPVLTKGTISGNKAGDSGGGLCVNGAGVELEKPEMQILGNSAKNGGGVAVLNGDFILDGGAVGVEPLQGETQKPNTASEKGGGVYVSEGNVYVIYGEITYNHASMDGGGFFISADKKNSDVLMLSGSLSYNTAEKNGGGMAVRSDNTTSSEIAVEIGCLMYHPVENGRPKSFSYEGDSKYGEYASFDNKKYEHESCPVVKHNNAGIKGGGFYLDSDSSTISFYCIEESENTAADINGAGMDVEGGGVIIGDEAYHNHSHDQSSAGQKLDKPRGYIKTGNATMVNGGQVDIYGDMDNPSFIDEVMVDILDSTHDHFRDHRRSEEKEVYKVHYFENFVGGTGLYTATEYSEPNLKFPVEGALYNRPGYEIRGWCTTAVYDKDDPDSKYYSVGEMIDLTDEKLPGMGIYEETSCDICKNHTDATLLKLYAIWKVNGYLVHFDPNVPVGETYSGSMEDQSFNYDQEKNLTENIFKYTGHIFEGWTINADGTGNLYEDKQPVKNLTTVAGETVTLYAKWKVCDHKDSHRWSYDVIDDGKTLRRKCDCGGQTLHATLSAEDTVYDGYTHEATLTLDDKEAWGEDAPTVTYTGKWINEDIHTGVEGDSPLGSESVPRHAGIYTASITKLDTNSGGNTQNPVTASVEYTIAKADQPAPDKPDYTPPDAGDKTVTIKKLAADPTELTDKAGEHQEAKAQYRLNYSGSSDVAWEYIGSEDGLTKTMDTAYTTYFVEARYEELNDYNASEITRANSAYFFAGNVRVEVECDDGIDYKINFAEGTSDTDNGITMELTLKNGYYLINGKYAVTAQRWKIDTGGNKEEGTSESMPVDGSNDKPSIQNIPNDSYLLIHIGEARKNPAVKAAVVPKQVFSSITGAETTISRDSAYTAAFRVDNYVPDFYNIPKLTFDSNIPEETTIILLERQTNGAKNYWYYRAVNETREVPLTAFQKMGENGAAAYAVPPLGIDEEYANLNYQFIVDFSQSADGYSEDELNMTLEAAHSNEAEAVDAPAIESSVKVSMKDKTFGLTPEETNGNGLTNSFTCTFNVDGSAAASKWDDRASALILKPVNNPVLPADARIKAVIGGETTYLYKNKESFIVPLSLLNTEKKVSLTLESALFPKEEAKYEFTAEWLVSPSKAGKAPVKGDMVGGLQQVIFKSAEKQTPSLKSEGAQRVLTTQGTLNLDIKKENLGSYFIEAKLLRKSESTGEYIETGWNTSPVGDKLEVGLAGQTPGSFCLMLYVKENKDSVAVEMRVPYYFVIKQTE